MALMTAEEQNKSKKTRVDNAVKLASDNRWEEALTANHELLEAFGDDVSTFNRLGKAYLELGRYAEARGAYGRSVEIDPGNAIARKNLDRLSNVDVDEEAPLARGGVDPSLFVEETGKTAIVQLLRPAPPEVLGKLTTGDKVQLAPEGRALMVLSSDGEHLGQIETRLGLRLVNFLSGGNRYEAAVIAIDQQQVRVIIRETYQHPSQFGKVSFPPRDAADGFRGYIKGSVIHYEADDDDDVFDDGDYGSDSDGDGDEALDDHEPMEEDDHRN